MQKNYTFKNKHLIIRASPTALVYLMSYLKEEKTHQNSDPTGFVFCSASYLVFYFSPFAVQKKKTCIALHPSLAHSPTHLLQSAPYRARVLPRPPARVLPRVYPSESAMEVGDPMESAAGSPGEPRP